MIPIPIEEYIKQHLKSNPQSKESKIRQALLVAIKKKQAGVKCDNCGSEIWAIGTALVEWNGCFSCITGEADSSEDYEVDTVAV